MKRIFKYAVTNAEWFLLTLPKGARVLSVQTQFHEPQLWVLVDDEADTEVRKFLCIGTGQDASRVENARFVGTFQLGGGRQVWHLFEATKEAG